MGPGRSFIVSASPGGSLGRCFRGVVDHLEARGNRVTFVVPPAFADLGNRSAASRVVPWPVESASSPAWLRFMADLIGDVQPDAVVGSFAGDLGCLVAAARHRVPNRIVFHHTPTGQARMDSPIGSDWRLQAQTVRRALTYRLATTVLCSTPFMRDDLRRTYRVPADRIVIEPYAIPDPGPAAGHDRNRVVCLGRFDRSKGQDILVGAVGRLGDLVPEAEVRFVGAGSSEQIEALARRLGVADRCRFLGHLSREDVFDELGRASVAVFPSREEGFGVVTLEAQAVGTPIVASDIPSFRTPIADGVTGLLVPLEDRAAMAEAIAELLVDDARRDRMGVAARRRFLRDFEIGARGDAIAETYERAAARTR